MKKIVFSLYIILSLLFLVYLFLPSPNFPNPPFDAYQSEEEADTETPLRRAYFTNFTREQVIDHYLNQFNRHSLRLNYPPEDAQTLIRDQTRSVYLEELVHPFRESLYINGFEPRVPKDDIWYKGVHYQAKITIRYSQSNKAIRLVVALLTIVVGWFLLNSTINTGLDLAKVLWKRK